MWHLKWYLGIYIYIYIYSTIGIVDILVCYLSSFPRSFNTEINYVAICSNSSHRLTGLDWTIVRMDGPMGGGLFSFFASFSMALHLKIFRTVKSSCMASFMLLCAQIFHI